MLPPLLVLFSWPVVGLVLFRNLHLPLACLVTVVGGFLFLPEETVLDLPGLTLDKHSVPILTALCLALIFGQRDASSTRPEGLIPRHKLALVLLILLATGGLMTALTNSDTLRYGWRSLQGTSLYDAASIISGALTMILPLFLARRYLADAAAQRLILKVLCIAALGYSLLALYEIRMSPQLNLMVYGFFPHSWAQHFRAGGWRPVVFLSHGLTLGIFLAMAALAIAGLARLDASRRKLWIFGTAWLLAMLFLSKNIGALFIMVALLPVVLLGGVRGQLLVAAIVCGVFLAYPVARTAQILPYTQVLNLAESIDPERVRSFQTRLDNEERMLEKAKKRPLFGWAGFGRSRVFDDRGADITIADGGWIIVLGQYGWVGYLARFGLLTAPIFLLMLHRRRYEIGMETSLLAVILSANIVDLVPNSSNTPVTWLLAGALWGRLELERRTSALKETTVTPPGHAGYRRPDPPEAVADPQPVTSSAAAPLNAYTRQTKRINRKEATAR